VNGIFTIDTRYVRPHMDASHLILDGGRAAFVDTGSEHSVPFLLEALAEHNIDAAQVDYLMLTHVHLDHAGGAGRLAAALPRAKVLVHPRGAPHLADPSRLIAATRAVYGAQRFAELYGDIRPIPAARIAAVSDGQKIVLGTRTWEFIHTPGHALHHVCIVDREAGDIFTGDTFGVSYREFDTAAGEFVFTTSTPTQFDPSQLHASVERLLKFEPRALYLTHYGRVGDAPRLGADLHADIDAFVSIARGAASAADPVADMAPKLFAHLSARLDAHGFAGDAARRHAILDGDIELNAAGLAAWLARGAS
jgi:glyoxylase-like metal-dependent hydrolase (beta-lactamase superfamily II)